jgi:hypothetical protein
MVDFETPQHVRARADNGIGTGVNGSMEEHWLDRLRLITLPQLRLPHAEPGLSEAEGRRPTDGDTAPKTAWSRDFKVRFRSGRPSSTWLARRRNQDPIQWKMD